MTADAVPVGISAVAVVLALIGFFRGEAVSEWVRDRARARQHGEAGWTTAVSTLQEQMGELRSEVRDLRAEVDVLRHEAREKDHRILELESTVTEQSHALTRANGRVRQLEHAWPASFTMPVADPGLS